MKSLALGLTALLLAPATYAQEVTAGRHDLQADTQGVSMMLEAKDMSIMTILQKLTVCNASAKFYRPDQPTADANGCVSGGAIPTGGVAAFDLDTCPAGWSPFTNANGRFIVGTGTLATDVYARGVRGGEARHILTTAEMPRHRHRVEDRYGEASSVGRDGNKSRATAGYEIEERKVYSEYAGGDATGATAAHENRPPYIALLMCVKD